MQTATRIAFLFLVATLTVLSSCSCAPDITENQTDAAAREANAAATKAQRERPTSPAPADNSRLSLDWAGTYSGIIPCASCPGIESVITLFADGSFERSRRYLDESPTLAVDTGPFSWNDAGSIVTLNADDNETQRFQVGEHRLFQLDRQGKRIEGNLANRYILHQHIHDHAIEDVRWELTELNGQSVRPADYRAQPFLFLESETSRINGNSSCNSFSGSYTIKSNQHITFGGGIGMTRMACPNMNTEQAFIKVLETTGGYRIDGDGHMTLHGEGMQPLARFQPGRATVQ